MEPLNIEAKLEELNSRARILNENEQIAAVAKYLNKKKNVANVAQCFLGFIVFSIGLICNLIVFSIVNWFPNHNYLLYTSLSISAFINLFFIFSLMIALFKNRSEAWSE